MILTGVITAGLASWLVTPWVQMSRRGTLDQQAVAGWRTEDGPRAPADVAIPAPRTAPSADRVTA